MPKDNIKNVETGWTAEEQYRNIAQIFTDSECKDKFLDLTFPITLRIKRVSPTTLKTNWYIICCEGSSTLSRDFIEYVQTFP